MATGRPFASPVPLGSEPRPGRIVLYVPVQVSSRLLTYLSLRGLPPSRRLELIEVANRRLANLREASHDLVLSPFKGNNKAGKRRRRLDYALARTLLQDSLREMQLTL